MKQNFFKFYSRFYPYNSVFFAGLLLPLGFAPFHFYPVLFISLAWFYTILLNNPKTSFSLGFIYGLAFYVFALYWVYSAMYNVCQMVIASLFLTLLFLIYLSLFTGLVSFLFNVLNKNVHASLRPLIFSSLWTISEIIRAHFLGGFPWLLLGYAQIDTFLAPVIPYLGVYGVGFLACVVATLISEILRKKSHLKYLYSIPIIALVLFKPSFSTQDIEKPLSVTIIQANETMKNKWDLKLFNELLKSVESKINQNLDSDLIVLPETTISVAVQYLDSYFNELSKQAKKFKTAVLVGVPFALNNTKKSQIANSLYVIGEGSGEHLKHHLVLFGEYVPNFLKKINHWFDSSNFIAGDLKQKLAYAQGLPFISLICFELAFEDIIRAQASEGQWIVSISDDAIFGNTIEPYQQIQIAQVRSLQTHRYQIVANNNGLSAIISPNGQIMKNLPYSTEGILKGTIEPLTTSTVWMKVGNDPIYIILIIILISSAIVNLKISTIDKTEVSM